MKVTDATVGRRTRFAPPNLAIACLALLAIVLVAGAVSGTVAYQREGEAGVRAIAVAAGSCWFSATIALVLAGSLRNTPHAVSGILGGTLVRLMLPLAVAAGAQASGSSLVQAGLFGYLVLFFLLTLTVETLLLVWLLGFGSKLPKARNMSEAA